MDRGAGQVQQERDFSDLKSFFEHLIPPQTVSKNAFKNNATPEEEVKTCLYWESYEVTWCVTRVVLAVTMMKEDGQWPSSIQSNRSRRVPPGILDLSVDEDTWKQFQGFETAADIALSGMEAFGKQHR